MCSEVTVMHLSDESVAKYWLILSFMPPTVRGGHIEMGPWFTDWRSPRSNLQPLV